MFEVIGFIACIIVMMWISTAFVCGAVFFGYEHWRDKVIVICVGLFVLSGWIFLFSKVNVGFS
jgi:hypothetical protein